MPCVRQLENPPVDSDTDSPKSVCYVLKGSTAAAARGFGRRDTETHYVTVQ